MKTKCLRSSTFSLAACDAARLFVRGLSVAGLAGLIVSLGGCGVSFSGTLTAITGSGRTVTQQYELTDFSKVEAGNTFEVEITQGESYRVSVVVDDNVAEHLSVSRSGDTLRLFIQDNTSLRNVTLKAQVTMPSLAGLDLSGASRAAVSGFDSGTPLSIRLSGASSARGNLKTGDADFRASGASRLDLEGTASALKAHVSGASHIDLEKFRSGTTAVDASGASHATVNPGGHLTVDASGASSVRYVGEPASVRANTSGASSVKQK